MYLSITGLKPHGVNESKNLMHHRLFVQSCCVGNSRKSSGWMESVYVKR